MNSTCRCWPQESLPSPRLTRPFFLFFFSLFFCSFFVLCPQLFWDGGAEQHVGENWLHIWSLVIFSKWAESEKHDMFLPFIAFSSFTRLHSLTKSPCVLHVLIMCLIFSFDLIRSMSPTNGIESLQYKDPRESVFKIAMIEKEENREEKELYQQRFTSISPLLDASTHLYISVRR